MNSSQYKRAIDKYLTNVVFRNTDFNYDIDVTYHDGHKKNIIMITIHIDLAKLLKNHPDFDEKYHDIAWNLEDKIENMEKFFGMTYKEFTLILNFNWTVPIEVKRETEELEQELNRFVEKEYDGSFKVWVGQRYMDDDHIGMLLEIGSDETINERKIGSLDPLKDYSYYAVANYPLLNDIMESSGDIDFWFEY